MQCPKCAHTNRSDAGFCASCGASLAYLRGRMRLQPGQTLKAGGYKVVRPLTRGGMGAIYLIEDQDAFGRVRVLKEMLDYVDPADYPDRASYEEAVQRAHERFEDEGRILASLHHRGIPEIIAYFSELGRNYIVMEYVEGRDLSQGLTHVDGDGQLVPGGPYPLEEVVRWGVQVCQILEYLAERKPTPVIHHDIKPANLVLDKHSGDIRLVDFGTAQVRLAAQGGGKVGMHRSSIFGTAGYAPPEQYQGKSVPQSDVFALAATMYHLLTDDDPQQHPMSFPWPVSLPTGLARAMARAVEPDLRKRSTAAQLRTALENWSSKPKTARVRDRKGNYRVVLMHVPEQQVPQTVAALQQELGITEVEATVQAYSAPVAVLRTTSYAQAAEAASRLQLAGTNALLAEVQENYSRSLDSSPLRDRLLRQGQVDRIVGTKLGRDRRCHCFACGHDWVAPRTFGRKPPDLCPQCKSSRWSVRRAFKCRVCGHEFAHGDHERPPQQLFPACPACGTIDWLVRRDPVLRVRRSQLDLGTVRLGQKKSVTISLSNRGEGTLRGIIRSREPWLQVEQSFNGDGEIRLPLDTAKLSGETHYQGVVDVLSNGGAKQIRLAFLAQTPEEIQVSPSTLDFGQVDAQPALQVLQVSNSGGGELRGTVRANVPWLTISPSDFASNAVELQIEVRPAEMLPGKTGKAKLKVSSNGGEVIVPAKARALPAKIALSQALLDFGSLAPKQKRSLTVRVTNAGAGRLRGRVTTWPDWLGVRKTRWSGNRWDLILEADGRRLSDGIERRGVVHLTSNGGEADLAVRAVALGPVLAVEPSGIDFGTMRAGGRARMRLRLSNSGHGDLSGRVGSKASWLELEPRQFFGRKTTVHVRLQTKGLAPGPYATTIEIESSGGSASVPVRVQLTPARSLGQTIRLFQG